MRRMVAILTQINRFMHPSLQRGLAATMPMRPYLVRGSRKRTVPATGEVMIESPSRMLVRITEQQIGMRWLRPG